MRRKQTQFIVVRNGEHMAIKATAEAAASKLDEIKAEDIRLHQAGWFTSDTATFTYYIFTR